MIDDAGRLKETSSSVSSVLIKVPTISEVDVASSFGNFYQLLGQRNFEDYKRDRIFDSSP